MSGLHVRDLRVEIDTGQGVYPVVKGISFDVPRGQTLCIVGESGCGKSMAALSLMRLLPDAARLAGGRVELSGEDLATLPQSRLEDLRGDRIGFIFQEPLTSLNPVMTVGAQIAEVVIRHRKLSRKAAHMRAVETLRHVGMPDPERRARQYPHELSGGMRQRAMIAVALACAPEVLIADEPTTALDVTIQAQILDLLADLQERDGMGLVMITHDFGVVLDVADHVLVMYAGHVVEEAPVADLFAKPLHPYTSRLMKAAAAVEFDADRGERFEDIPGAVPALWDMPQGCPFAPRCDLATPRCHAEMPPLEAHRPGHKAACWEIDHG